MLTDHLKVVDEDVESHRQAVAAAQAAAAAAQEDFRRREGEALNMRGRLTYLEALRKKLAEWEPAE